MAGFRPKMPWHKRPLQLALNQLRGLDELYVDVMRPYRSPTGLLHITGTGHGGLVRYAATFSFRRH